MCKTSFVVIAVVALGFFAAHSPPAVARPPYNAAFSELYLQAGSPLTKVLGDAKSCNVCHIGADRKKRNEFGTAFGKELKKNANKPDAIQSALDKVVKQKSKAKDAKSATFAKLIEEGTLPITK